MADSQRGTDVNPFRPTLSFEKNHLSPEACRFPLTTIYTIVPLTEYCASGLLEAHRLVLCGCNTFSLPPALGCRLRVYDPHFAQGSASAL
jgi:hypothetical protein